MKRNINTKLTLWEAAHIQKYKTFQQWDESRRLLIKEYQNLSQKKGLNYNDFPDIKKQKTEEEDNKFDIVTFNIGLKLKSGQRKLMNTILKVYNTTYNWCSWLVSEKILNLVT